MTQRHIISGILLLVVLLSGCADSAKQFTDNFMGKDQNEVDPNPTVQNVQQVTLNPYSFEPSKLTYYFCDNTEAIYANNPSLGVPEKIAENGYALCSESLNKFMSFTDTNSGLRCQFPALEDKTVADQLVYLHHQGVAVHVVFGKAYTMKFCETGCLPVKDSQFTYLLAEGVGIQFAEGVNESYCVNEKGVWFGSFVPSVAHNPINSSSYIVYDTKFTGAFNQRFKDVWKN